MKPSSMESLQRLNRVIAACKKCPRLVLWRTRVAAEPPRRYRGDPYWARPVPGFGDSGARVLVVGLAPAAHGGNRTGRVFTGDRSGEWVFEALFEFGFANQPVSRGLDDGLELKDCYISAAVRCAPPANKPTTVEFDNCRDFLVREIQVLENLRVVVALGKVAFDSFLRAYTRLGTPLPKPRPQFTHGGVFAVTDSLTLLGSYHPSQQNTFTGKLTRSMFHQVFRTARDSLSS